MPPDHRDPPRDSSLRPRRVRSRKHESDKLAAQIALRIGHELLARLDRHVVRLRRREPAAIWSRGSAIRALMLDGLLRAENEEKAGV